MSRLQRLVLLNAIAAAMVVLAPASAMAKPSNDPAAHRKIASQQPIKREIRASNGTKVATTVPHRTLSAAATPVTSGEFWFSGVDNDYISQDKVWSYKHPAASITMTTGIWDRGPHLTITAAGNFSLELEAPNGANLAVGRYAGATRFPFNSPTTPGLTLSGGGRGCNASIGWFEIHQITVNASKEVEAVDVTFEQHCAGDSDAAFAFGHVLVNATRLRQPPTLGGETYGVAAFSKRTMYGYNNGGNLYGNVTCSATQNLLVRGSVTRDSASIPFKGTVACVSGQPTEFRIFATQLGWAPFTPGQGTSTLLLMPQDPYLVDSAFSFSPTILVVR